MSTNHESINSQPAPSVENQWSDLEKMGKSESRSESDFEEVRKETIQESQETKQAKLEELATKVREAYSNTEQAEVSKAQAGPEAKSSDIQLSIFCLASFKSSCDLSLTTILYPEP